MTTDKYISVPMSVPSQVTHAFVCLNLYHRKWHMHFIAYICAITIDTCILVPYLCHHQWHMHFSARICAITSDTCISVLISVPSQVTHAFQCHICAISSASVPLQFIADIGDKVTIYTIQYTVVLYLALFQNAKLHHVHFHFTQSSLLSL